MPRLLVALLCAFTTVVTEAKAGTVRRRRSAAVTVQQGRHLKSIDSPICTHFMAQQQNHNMHHCHCLEYDADTILVQCGESSDNSANALYFFYDRTSGEPQQEYDCRFDTSSESSMMHCFVLDFVNQTNNDYDATTHTVKIHNNKRRRGKHSSSFWSPSCHTIKVETMQAGILPSPKVLRDAVPTEKCEICASSRENDGFYQLSTSSSGCVDTRLLSRDALFAPTTTESPQLPTSTYSKKHIYLPAQYETSCSYLSQYYELFFDDAHCLCKHAKDGTVVQSHHHLSVRCVVHGDFVEPISSGYGGAGVVQTTSAEVEEQDETDIPIHNIIYMFDAMTGAPFEAVHCHDDYCVVIFFNADGDEDNKKDDGVDLTTMPQQHHHALPTCHVTFPRSGATCPSDTYGGECNISKTYLEDAYFHVDVVGCGKSQATYTSQQYRSWIIYPQPEGPFCTGYPPADQL